MKYFFFLLIVITIKVHAQPILNFDKRFVQCEDRWVAFQPKEDSSYPYGFIYIDEQAGLTAKYEGTFKVSPTGAFVPEKPDGGSIRARLEPNNILVALIPEEKFKELEISAIPDWLKFYKTDTNSIVRLYKWGFMYNAWGECAKALTYLERAQKTEPGFEGLGVELAYSYNCIGQYDKAIPVLKDVLKKKTQDAYANKELVFAFLKAGQLDKASESCKKAIASLADNTYNGENCYNILYEYYAKKDKPNFSLWVNEAKKWNEGNAQLLQNIALMENEMK